MKSQLDPNDVSSLKAKLFDQVIHELTREQETLLRAAQDAYEGATHAEVKQENKYDTRGLESSYLAFGQSKRALEIGTSIEKLRMMIRLEVAASTSIRLGDLLQLEKEDESLHWYFLLPGIGGFTILMDKEKVQVISGSSPMGAELLGKEVGDEAIMTISGQKKSLSIIRKI